MTELNRGELVVNADGSLHRCTPWGIFYALSPTEVNVHGWESAEKLAGHLAGLGYTRLFPDAPATIGPFGSGASLKTDGSQITGRVEAQSKTYHYKGAGSVAVMVGDGRGLFSVKVGEVIEPKRAPLDWNKPTPFDTFGPGFKVRSDTGWMTGEDGHPLQRMTADSPTHGSAHLLLSKTA